MSRAEFHSSAVVGAALAALLAGASLSAAAEPLRWWKGNLHTHTLWSDGDDFPEMVVDWYKTNGYHFLALSDHNTLQQGTNWLALTDPDLGPGALDKYQARFGSNWVELRDVDGTNYVRLKTLREFRRLFEEPGRFLLLQAEEITDSVGHAAVHVCASNLRFVIRPQGGTSVVECIQRNVNAVLRQRDALREPILPHLAHPNFGWSITAEDMIAVKGERFFEVYNGHPRVGNFGSDRHPGVERMWDIVLTHKIALHGEPPLFGLAVDDAHKYHHTTITNANPGRGWVWARAAALTPDDIIGALERGDFYASTGVRLKDVVMQTNRLALVIDPEPGVAYTTQFIGTRRGFDPTSRAVTNAEGEPLRITRIYSPEIGAVLQEQRGLTPEYTLRGDEIYVRAKVISTKPKANPFATNEVEVAWTQPLAPTSP